MANTKLKEANVKRARKKIIPCTQIGEMFPEFKANMKSGHNDKELMEELNIDNNALDQLKMLLALEECGQLYTNRTIYKKYFKCAPPRSISVTKLGIIIRPNKIEELGAKDIFSENTEIAITFENNKLVVSKI